MKEADDKKIHGGYMIIKGKKGLLFLLTGVMILSIVACGNSQTGNTENSQMETESEKVIEIADANDILTKVWETYEDVDTDGNIYNDKFDIMGGHFETAVMGQPAKYDLTQTEDLMKMYCVPESEILNIDDIATMIDLYNAGRFTVVAFHVSDVENVQSLIDGIESQVATNQWHGEKPDKLLIMKIGKQYILSIYGRELLVDEFEQKLMDIYSKIASVVVEQEIH